MSNRPEVRQKYSKSVTEYWKNLSDDERKERCNAIKGKKNGMYGKHPIYVYNEETDHLKMIFSNEEAEKYI